MKNFNFFYGGHMKKYLTLLIILFLSSNLINAQWYNQSSGVYEIYMKLFSSIKTPGGL